MAYPYHFEGLSKLGKVQLLIIILFSYTCEYFNGRQALFK